MHRPVINTHRFFNLFGSLKKRFERQGVTYTSAGVFLHTLKTLMAKLKVEIIEIVFSSL